MRAGIHVAAQIEADAQFFQEGIGAIERSDRLVGEDQRRWLCRCACRCGDRTPRRSPSPAGRLAAESSPAISGRLLTVPTMIAGRSSGLAVGQFADGQLLLRDSGRDLVCIMVLLQVMISPETMLPLAGQATEEDVSIAQDDPGQNGRVFAVFLGAGGLDRAVGLRDDTARANSRRPWRLGTLCGPTRPGDRGPSCVGRRRLPDTRSGPSRPRRATARVCRTGSGSSYSHFS